MSRYASVRAVRCYSTFFKSKVNLSSYRTIDTMISESHPDNYETDLNNKEAIQANELKLHVFCFKLLDILLDSISKVSTMLPKVFETIDNLLNILNETKNEWSQLNVVSKSN